MDTPNEESDQHLYDRISPYLPYLFCGCLAIVFAGLTVRDNYRQREQQLSLKNGTVVPNINASVLLSNRTQFDGNINAPFTLVEFGDFQCPPCRFNQPLVVGKLAKYSGRLKLDFRELPLTTIHPHAKEAALAAESARIAGKFWPIHDQLFTTDFSVPGAISKVMSSKGVANNDKLAEKQLATDGALESQLSVHSTPSFFLCRPDGSVVRLPEINAIDANLTN